MTRLAILALFVVVVLSACSSGTPIKFRNQSEYRLEAVELSGTGFKASIGAVDPGRSVTVRVRPAGESGLAVSFMANGQRFSFKPYGYFEGRSGYKVSATVTRDLRVAIDTDLWP